MPDPFTGHGAFIYLFLIGLVIVGLAHLIARF
jgi:hypothetical protein